MHRNNILNPAPLSKEAQYLQRQGGKAGYAPQATQAGSLIFPTQDQPSAHQQLKPSIQVSQHGTKYHHHSSSIVMQDFDASATAPKHLSDAQVSALSDIQQRILAQNKEMDLLQQKQRSSQAAARPPIQAQAPLQAQSQANAAPAQGPRAPIAME